MIPVGGAEIAQADTLWAGLSGVLESCVGGQGGEETTKEPSGQEPRDSARSLRVTGVKRGKTFAKCKSASFISHPLSSASRNLPDKCGLRGCSLLWKEASAPPAEPKSPWPERTPRDQSLPPPTSSLLLYPLCFS